MGKKKVLQFGQHASGIRGEYRILGLGVQDPGLGVDSRDSDTTGHLRQTHQAVPGLYPRKSCGLLGPS